MKKSYLILGVMILIFSLLSFSLLASADDDDHHGKDDYDEYKSYKRYDHDDHDDDDYDDDEDYDDYDEEDDDYYDDYEKGQSETIIAKEFWYKWSRSAAEPVEFEQLPITESESSALSLVVDHKQPVQTEIIPKGSQVMVPIDEVAKMLGAEVTIYANSEIIEINKDNKQLIVRNNSKVVYENMRKTPMQEAVSKQNGKYFIPIAVLANGLGYEMNGQVDKNQIHLERVVQL